MARVAHKGEPSTVPARERAPARDRRGSIVGVSASGGGTRVERGDGVPAGPAARRAPAAPGSMPGSRRSSTTPAARCSCSPAPARGKTTTIVEAVGAPDRGRGRPGADPACSPSAARPRPSCGSGSPPGSRRTIREPLARTFHSLRVRRAARRGGRRAASAAPRLLTAAEQDAGRARAARRRRRGGRASAGRPSCAPALVTRGFARAARAAAARHRARGRPAPARDLGPRDRGRTTGSRPRLPGAVPARHRARRPRAATRPATTRPSWSGRRSPSSHGDPELLRQERDRRRRLFVDEYQDTDPAQVELLELLAGGGDNLVAVGDPDQAIYAFRGADPRGIVEFPDAFRHDGRPAGAGGPLGVVPPVGRDAAARSAAGSPTGCPAREHRGLRRPRHRPGPGRGARVRRTAVEEAAYLADVLRRAHLLDGRAVVGDGGGRRGRPSGTCRRCAARWPRPACRSPSAADDLPLAAQPAVAPFLRLLECALAALAGARPGAAEPARPLAEDAALTLAAARRRGRARAAPARGRAAPARPAPAAPAVRDRTLAAAAHRPGRAGAPLAAAARRRPAARRRARQRRPAGAAGRPAPRRRPGRRSAGGSAEDVLWAMWQAQRAGRPLGAAVAAAGGPAGAVADRDLDASSRCSTRPRASSTGCRRPTRGRFVDHLSAQELPGDTRRRPGADRRDGPAAHRARRQGSGVGPGLRRRRAGGRLARPAPARHPARRRGAGRAGRRQRAGERRPVAARPGRGAAAVLRRVHPGPAAADRRPAVDGDDDRRPGSSTWSRRRPAARAAAHRAAPRR